jgi:hypothetical protein
MRPVWLHLALLKQCDLFAQEEFLGCQCAARPGNEHEEAHETGRDGRQRGEAVCQQWKTEPGMNVALWRLSLQCACSRVLLPLR